MPFGKKKSLFAEMAEEGKAKKESKDKPKESKGSHGVKEVTVRVSDNGGYIVSYHKPEESKELMIGMGSRVEKVYPGLEGVSGCIAEVLGKKAGGGAEKA